MDNGTQFNNQKVEGFCKIYGIRINYSPVYHPQVNGMVEATNKMIVENMWRNLEDKKGAWLEELPKVLWAQRTTKKRATDESPFALVFKTESVLPTEVGLPTMTTMVAENVDENQRQLTRNLDFLKEVREYAQIRRAAYQQKAWAFYNQKAKIRRFTKGEWVLRRIPEVVQKGKFGEQWEGPFEIREALGKGTYRLTNVQNWKDVPRTWNAMYLRKYFL